MRRILIVVGALALVAAVVVWFLIAPKKLPASALAAGYAPNLANGEAIFIAGNCTACHKTPNQEDRKHLAGGLKLTSPFGDFIVPNITPDPKAGIGAWSELEFVNAMKRGTGRRGEHLYPAFPYPSYALLKTNDVRDLWAYMKTLPADPKATAGHDIKFPYNLRPALGFWKLLYFKADEFKADPAKSEAWNRGAYLAEGALHCSSCHTPRNSLGGPDDEKLYAGAPNLEPGGRFAGNITPHKDGMGDWTEADMVSFLQTGTDKCFNEPEGMREVTAATSQMPEADLAAIATYLHALKPIAGNPKHKTC